MIANVGGKKAGIVAFDAKTRKGALDGDRRRGQLFVGVGATISGSARDVPHARGPGWSRSRERAGAVSAAVAGAPGRVGERRNADRVGDLIFVSAEYGPGAGVLQFEGTNLVDVWLSDEVLSNHYATSVHARRQPLWIPRPPGVRPELSRGRSADRQSALEHERFGAGSVTLAGNRLVILRESGELVLAAASPEAFQPLARRRCCRPPCARIPALADGILYVRNDNTLVAVDLRMRRFSVLGAGFRVGSVRGSVVRAVVLARRIRRRCSNRAVAEFERGRFASRRPRSTSS